MSHLRVGVCGSCSDKWALDSKRLQTTRQELTEHPSCTESVRPTNGKATCSPSEPGSSPASSKPARPLTLALIADAVLLEMRMRGKFVDWSDLLTNSRRPEAVLARSAIFFLARLHLHLSYKELSRRMGRHGHSTAITAVKRMQRLVPLDTPEREFCHMAEATLAQLATSPPNSQGNGDAR